MILETVAFEGGHCRQLLAMIDRRSWRLVKFPAVFLALRHSREGWVLVDTGYGLRFAAATRRLPYRFYRWVTPATAAGGTAAQLAGAGIRAEEVRHVIVTHFHADHVGGLVEFPQALVHHHAEALAPLQRLSAWRQARAAFLPDLIPAWLPQQARPVAVANFSPAPDLPFPVFDLFGDDSIRLISLPGHAPGQIGIAFASARGPELYAADAFWRGCQLTEAIEPFAVAMSLQWDAAAYRRTVEGLRKIHQFGRHRITACHDDGAAARFNPPRLAP